MTERQRIPARKPKAIRHKRQTVRTEEVPTKEDIEATFKARRRRAASQRAKWNPSP